MSELRKDLVTGRWVIIASERSKRPDDFRPAAAVPPEGAPAFCPFCEGNESKTPPEVFALRRKGSSPVRRNRAARSINSVLNTACVLPDARKGAFARKSVNPVTNYESTGFLPSRDSNEPYFA